MNSLSPILDVTEYYIPIAASEIFRNGNASALEIGFGEGDFLIEMAQKKPGWNFIGVELKKFRWKKAVKKASRAKAANLKLLHMDAEIAVSDVFPQGTFGEVYINFPDPWPKERHKKHRIINRKFLRKLYGVMQADGVLEIASDHEEYISHMLETMRGTGLFESMIPPPGYINAVQDRPATKFETEFRQEGREIYYLRFRKITEENK